MEEANKTMEEQHGMQIWFSGNTMITAGLVILIISAVLFVVGGIVALTGIPSLKKALSFNDEYNKLERQKKKLERELKEEKALEAKEQTLDEDELLKLLSEGKITIEEYKKLSKK